jgi:NRAMP (natural resistance-associated macrophage protein)-like metal ion transporter
MPVTTDGVPDLPPSHLPSTAEVAKADLPSALDVASSASATGDAAEDAAPERLATPTTSKRRGTFRKALRVLGPGLITGAADDDPSGIGTYAQAGAGFGFAQLWLVLYMLPLMIAVQEMCGRIGLVTRQGVAGVVRKHYSRGVLYPVVALVFIANTFNLGADLGGMAAATRLLVPMVPFAIMVILFGIVILALEIYVPYRQYARVLKYLALALLAYVFTALVIRPDWGHILRATLLPQIQPTSAYLLLVVGLLGTTISPYLFFWQASEEVEEFNEQASDEGISAHNAMPKLERRKLRWGLMLRQLNRLKADTAIGMTVSESVAWFIMITTGGTLFTHGMTNITSADQAAAALVPLVNGFPYAGQLASLIFALGIVGAGLLAVPTLAGSAAYATAEAFGWREGLSRTLRLAPGFYATIAVSMGIGIALNLIGVNPIQALVYAAVLNGIVAVPLLALLLLISNNRTIMGEHTNSRLSNGVNLFATVAMAVVAAVTIVSLVHP